MERSERIDRIVGDCTQRLLQGEPIDVRAIIQSNPDLMPELGSVLNDLVEKMSPVRSPQTADDSPPEPADDAATSQCLSSEDTKRLLNGTLPPDELARIEEHLKLCDLCREEIEDQREFVTEMVELTSAPPSPPTISIPNHQIIRWIGRGGFGDVWLARHTGMNQERAVKIVDLRQRAGSDRERLMSEMEIMGALPRHRNRVMLHDSFVAEDNLVLVMEYIPGGPLSRRTSVDAPIHWQRACKYVGDVADGLVEVHAAGVLHRDIKPGNILLDEAHDEALLGDFGLATQATAAGGRVGTPGYTAPELLDGRATAKSDVFSLAATLFHLVAGHPPFDAADLSASLRQAAAGVIAPVEALSKVPKAVEEVILAGLEPHPERRIDLPTFIERLRGAHLQSLADQLRTLSRQSPVRLNVSVSTKGEHAPEFRPVVCQSQSLEPHRGMEVVPEPAPVASVQTGGLVRFETAVDADGYLTVLNLASSGELGVVFPNPSHQDNRIRAGSPHRVTVRMTPPPGTDRAAIIWTRQPHQLTPDQWRERIEAGEGAGEVPSEATRGMELVLHEADGQPADAWTAAVVTVVHHLPQPPRDRGAPTTLRSEFRDTEGVRGFDTAFSEEARTAEPPDGGESGPGDLPTELTLAPSRVSSAPACDPVDCSVFAPPSVPRGGSVMVQVFAHMPELAAEAERLAREFDEETRRRALKSLQMDIPRGEKLLFHLAAPGLEVDDPVQSIIWRGRTESVQFGVTAPEDCLKQSVVGTVIVSLGEQQIPVGHVKFKLTVSASESQDVSFRARSVSEAACRYKKAFVSYASADRSEVMKRVQLLERLKIDYFQDVLTLAPGERWEQALYRHIDECDLFLLFWSTHAKNSTWVLEEVRYALRRKGGDDSSPPELVPVIIEGPPPVEPPDDLRHLHFNDRLVYFMV